MMYLTMMTRKKRGRPTIGRAEPIISACMLIGMRDALGSLIASEPELKPSRPEAVRRALADRLRAEDYLSAVGDQL